LVVGVEPERDEVLVELFDVGAVAHCGKKVQ